MTKKTKNSEKSETKNTVSSEQESQSPDLVEDLQKQIAELTDLLQRTRAEFANYQKRMEDQQKIQEKFRAEQIIQKFIPIYDNFTLAMSHTDNPQECVAGVQMIRQQFWDVLANEGIKKLDLNGKLFDPRIAEAIQITTDETKEDNIIVKEITKAYLLHDKVIRHAKVVVNKKNRESEPDTIINEDEKNE